jgi:hypothetical protein
MEGPIHRHDLRNGLCLRIIVCDSRELGTLERPSANAGEVGSVYNRNKRCFGARISLSSKHTMQICEQVILMSRGPERGKPHRNPVATYHLWAHWQEPGSE